jgi:hypothetical protein
LFGPLVERAGVSRYVKVLRCGGLLLALGGCASSGGAPPDALDAGGSSNAGASGSAGTPAALPTSCETASFLPARVVRLASSELRDHVRLALPGVDESLLLVLDLQAEHVSKVSERVISAADFSAYYQAALALAQAYAESSAEAEPCRSGAADACAQVLQTAAQRLYRRPSATEEAASIATRFQGLLATHAQAEAAAAVIAGLLLSPQTLYRAEAGADASTTGVTPLSRAEVIDLASFAFTGRAAGPAVLAALSALDDASLPAALGSQVAAWTQHEDFRRRVSDFLEIRFGVQHLPELSRGDPAFTPEVKQAFTTEFRAFVGQTLLAPGGTFADLFSKQPAALQPGLEALYTLDPPGRRQGVLGLASLLAARAAPNGSDPVKRGMMVRVELLCESVPPPIAGADFDKVMVTEDMQTRERFETLAAVAPCSGCHQVINPPGYLFEEFDQLGRHRTTEKGRPINARGSLPAAFGSEPYPGVAEWDGLVPLSTWLGSSPQARTCFAAHFASYILAEPIPSTTQNCLLPGITARFQQSGRLDELAADLASSDLFLRRQRGAL